MHAQRLSPISQYALALVIVFTGASRLTTPLAFADGKVVPPRNYTGSLEERSQEAIIIFHGSEEDDGAVEDLILKIQVEGKAEEFAWVVPFPSEPKMGKEDPELFRELFNYVELRLRRPSKSEGNDGAKNAAPQAAADEKVKVIKRETVGSFDIAIVQEREEGGLNPWLEKEGYQPLENANDVLDFYREKEYVFACIKVDSKQLAESGSIESHPLRFTFKTGGRDGIFFPMKMTGLHRKPFDVNLYVFYRFWLNDKLSQFGYQQRGFNMRYRDWDTPECEADVGKSYSLPQEDPFLRNMAGRIPTVTKLFQKLHPGAKYYLTNIKARNLNPDDVRAWSDDLWLFPYYTDRRMVPYDARPGGPAEAGYPNATSEANARGASDSGSTTGSMGVSMIAVAILAIVLAVLLTRMMRSRQAFQEQYSPIDDPVAHDRGK